MSESIPARWPNGPGRSDLGTFALSIERGQLEISAALSLPEGLARADVPSGDFQSGLWEGDVFELFLSIGGGAGYYEFHLTPSGCCWAAHFGAVRELVAELPDVIQFTEFGDIAGSLKGRVSLDRLPVPIGGALVGNACAIIGRDPRSYGSWVEVATRDPDFHRPESWQVLPVELR